MVTTAYDLPTWAALPARPDEDLDRLARTAAEQLRVPRALVVLVSKGGQVFPGAYGLPEPWATRRSMPLSRSMALVTSTGVPLVVRDARAHPDLSSGPGVRDMGVVAYAGVPLWDVQGRPTGVLCVTDSVPRDWSEAELAALRDLAEEGTRQLQSQAVQLAEREARAAAVRDDAAARTAADAALAAFVEAEAEADRTRLVAQLSTALLSVATLPDLLRCLDRSVRSPLGAAGVLLGIAADGGSQVRVWATSGGGLLPPGPVAVRQLTDADPLTTAMRERRLVPVGSPAEGRAAFPGLVLPRGTETAVAVPLLLGQHHSEAGLLVAWALPRELDPPVLAVLGDLGRHIGHALDRVLLQEQRLRLAAAPTPVRATA